MRRRDVSEEEIAAEMYSCSEVDGIGILRIAFLNDHGRGDQFREVVHGESSKDLLEDVIRLFCMEMGKANGVFQLTERGFNSPASGIKELNLSRWKGVGVQICNNRFKRRMIQPESNDSERERIEDKRVMLAVFRPQIVEMNRIRDPSVPIAITGA